MTRTGWTRWENAQLIAQGVLEIGDGYRAKNSELGPAGLPFARAGNIQNGFHLEDADLLQPGSVRLAGEKISRPGDIVFTSKGTVGRFAFVKPTTPQFVYSPQLCYWRVKKPSLLDPRYLFYWMQGEEFLRQVHRVKSQTTIADYVSLGDQRRMYILAPPLPVQRTIAGILAAYDDLIENHTLRIANLEERARLLYDEWFVKFRFPGHERVRLVESEVGMVPEGWEVAPIGDVVQVLGGGTPSTKNPDYWNDGDILWFSPTDLTSAGTMFVSDSAKKITPLGLKESSARLFPAHSVMMTSRATIGVLAMNTREACTNQGFIICVPNERLSAYQIYHWLRNTRSKILHLALGTTFKEINRATFKAFKIAIPPREVSKSFHAQVHSVYQQIENLTQQNIILRQTRERLLPGLVAGEIDVTGWNAGEAPEMVSVLARRVAEAAGPVEPVGDEGMGWDSLWE